MWCFAFQILCDFSGYTDIARGAAQVMGFRLMVNFAQPYWASSIQDLWRRWHISLYTWFRDYLYFSLGGRRISLWRRVAAVMVVFFVVGLWHGANWTYLYGAACTAWRRSLCSCGPVLDGGRQNTRTRAVSWIGRGSAPSSRFNTLASA